ncbi:MAG: hypothetical protein OXH36_01975 [Bdellovibrionales bacterium]|nr:hypothetical protein [Bdellovibrionales bacterium]
MSNKPDNIVAEKIVEEFLKKQLLSEDRKEEWIRKLSLGEAYFEDWNLLADVYIQDQAKG